MFVFIIISLFCTYSDAHLHDHPGRDVWYPMTIMKFFYATTDCSDVNINTEYDERELHQCALTYMIFCEAITPKAKIRIEHYSTQSCTDCNCDPISSEHWETNTCYIDPDDSSRSFKVNWQVEDNACHAIGGDFPTEKPDYPTARPSISPTAENYYTDTFTHFTLIQIGGICTKRFDLDLFYTAGNCASYVIDNPDACPSGTLAFPRDNVTPDLALMCVCCKPPQPYQYNVPNDMFNLYQVSFEHRFNPQSTMTSYVAKSQCGPRGQVAHADLSHCGGNVNIIQEGATYNNTPAAIVEGCVYESYALYECSTSVLSTMVLLLVVCHNF